MRREERLARQPESAMTPSAWRARQSRSTPGLPRLRPSRKPALESLTRLRKPSSLAASSVRWLRSTLLLVDRAVVDEVGLEAEDRLDAVLLAGLVELDGAVHHPVVGEPERGLAERGGAGGQALDVRGAVEQRVLGVDVQVRAGVGAHGVAHTRGRARTVKGARGLAAPCGKPRSGDLGAVDPRLQERDGGAVAADDRAVAGRGRLAAQEMAERLGGHRHRRVRAALGRRWSGPPCRGRCRP